MAWTHVRRNDDTLPNKLCSGNHKATEEEGDQGILERRDLESETGVAGFKYSWRKMEVAAQDRTGWRKWSVACVPLGVTTHTSSHSAT